MSPSRAALVLTTFLFAGCAPADDGSCTEWPDGPAPLDGVVEESCGWYTLAVGERLYANVYVTEPEARCDETIGEGVALTNEPIYSAMSNDAPKWTYDLTAESAAEGVLVDITCEEGTRFQVKMDVE